jgi:hypothetical protein
MTGSELTPLAVKVWREPTNCRWLTSEPTDEMNSEQVDAGSWKVEDLVGGHPSHWTDSRNGARERSQTGNGDEDELAV